MTEETLAGRSFQDQDYSPEMIRIPPGEFMMGSPPDEPERGDEEGPRHLVTIDCPLAVGRFAVTFEEFDHFITTSGHHHRPGDGGRERGKRPVVNVSFEDAQTYCRWLTKETGQRYRLLSEAEWEYVARAGSDTPFWFGNKISPDQANYDARFAFDGGTEGPSKELTVPVGTFEPNQFGLFDVHGNVWEWVEDVDHPDYSGAPNDGQAWLTGSKATMRVLRGGSCMTRPGLLRSASRVWNFSDERDYDVGFRVARSEH